MGLFLVEGVKMCREVLRSGLEVERLFVAESYHGEPFPEEQTVIVSDALLPVLSDEKTPQKVVCRVKIPQNTLTIPQNACLILDGVSDPANVGAIIRTANASGYNEIYLTPDCADMYAPKSVRASMSGVFFVKPQIATREEILSLMDGNPIIVADMNGENAFTFNAPTKFALVIGNEGNGVSEIMRQSAQKTVKIPMSDTQESLNASVSAGILMYLLKQNEFRK